jgi:hypothetical protein
MMEPLSHYHCEIYHCKYVPINLNHASTCTSTCTINKCINHAPTCTKQPVINLYHKQVHPTMYQVCTNHVSTTHQPTSSTIHLMYVPTHQLLVSTMYSTCNSTKSPHQFHHPNMICSSVIDLVYMITFLQTFLNFNNKRLAFSSNFSLVSHA